jgi:hypothetical protein
VDGEREYLSCLELEGKASLSTCFEVDWYRGLSVKLRFDSEEEGVMNEINPLGQRLKQ